MAKVGTSKKGSTVSFLAAVHLECMLQAQLKRIRRNKSRKVFQPRTILCRDKEGMLLSEEDDILRRWAEHYDELLNTESLNQNVISQETYEADLDTDEPTPTLDVVENAIQKVKLKKAPGIDLIQTETIKPVQTLLNIYVSVNSKILDHGNLTEDWNWSIVCPAHKKGELTICSNYTGITLLCVAYKIFCNFLFNWLMPYVETTVSDYQCGYSGERSTVDQIFTVPQILEICCEHGKDTHHLFVHFKTHMRASIDGAYM